jgi:hypothetical protein
MQKFLLESAQADDRCHAHRAPAVPIEFAGLAAD